MLASPSSTTRHPPSAPSAVERTTRARLRGPPTSTAGSPRLPGERTVVSSTIRFCSQLKDLVATTRQPRQTAQSVISVVRRTLGGWCRYVGLSFCGAAYTPDSFLRAIAVQLDLPRRVPAAVPAAHGANICSANFYSGPKCARRDRRLCAERCLQNKTAQEVCCGAECNADGSGRDGPPPRRAHGDWRRAERLVVELMVHPGFVPASADDAWDEFDLSSDRLSELRTLCDEQLGEDLRRMYELSPHREAHSLARGANWAPSSHSRAPTANAQ